MNFLKKHAYLVWALIWIVSNYLLWRAFSGSIGFGVYLLNILVNIVYMGILIGWYVVTSTIGK